MFYKKLLTKFPKIHACALEPLQEPLKLYQQKTAKNPSQLHGVKFDWHNCTIEEYMDTQVNMRKYHFISAIHSIYYMKDPKNTLEYLYDILEPGGILLVEVATGRQGQCNSWHFILFRNKNFFGRSVYALTYTLIILLPPISSCSHCAMTGQWRCDDCFFHLLVAPVEGYKTVYLCYSDSYTVTTGCPRMIYTRQQDFFYHLS